MLLLQQVSDFFFFFKPHYLILLSLSFHDLKSHVRHNFWFLSRHNSKKRKITFSFSSLCYILFYIPSIFFFSWLALIIYSLLNIGRINPQEPNCHVKEIRYKKPWIYQKGHDLIFIDFFLSKIVFGPKKHNWLLFSTNSLSICSIRWQPEMWMYNSHFKWEKWDILSIIFYSLIKFKCIQYKAIKKGHIPCNSYL